ncbi:MAG: hypothetical protein MUF54_09695 [Polyangiaceae bacterium]|jgi:hypothetical protein|nr:hypothetical protein [Polyangiaceae bacterium]
MRNVTIPFVAAICCLVVMHGAAGADEPSVAAPTSADVSVLGGLVVRTATSDAALNPNAIGYDLAAGWGVQARAHVLPWLRASGYYVHSQHDINLPRGAAHIDYRSIDLSPLDSFSLGFRIEPTCPVTDRLYASLSVGAGWGRLTTDRMTVREASRSYVVQERAGVFVELPVGVGLSYVLLPSWVAVRAEATIATNIKQSGKLFESVAYVDSTGALGSVGPMPTQGLSSAFLFGATVLL